MVARVKNIWAALIFALGSACSQAVELDEEGEREADRLIRGLEEAGCTMDEDEVEDWRKRAAINQRSRQLLADFSISIDEIVQQETASDWRRQVCRQRKSIRSKFYLLPLFALLPLVLSSWQAHGLSGLATLFLIGWMYSLIGELCVSESDAEHTEMLRKSLRARRAGDKEKELEVTGGYVDKVLARLRRTPGEEIELLIRQSNHEPRN